LVWQTVFWVDQEAEPSLAEGAFDPDVSESSEGAPAPSLSAHLPSCAANHIPGIMRLAMRGLYWLVMAASAVAQIPTSMTLSLSALLLHGQCRKENGHEPILPERDTELRMSSDLKNEVTVAPLIKQLVLRQSPRRQPTEDKRARAEAESS
jgi:hypothetical protein